MGLWSIFRAHLYFGPDISLNTASGILPTLFTASCLSDRDQPSGFFSGDILTNADQIIERRLNENAMCKIIRYDEKHKQMYISTGVLKMQGAQIAAYYPSNPNEKCRLYTQMEILPCDLDSKFADFGDSGALVFLVNEHTDDMWAIGMIVGGVSSGAGIVTPIWAILDSFGLPMKLLSFNNHRMKKIEQSMDDIQKDLKEILKRLPPR